MTSRLPPWFRQEIPDMKPIRELKSLLRSRKIHTVCEGARCPNAGHCWSKGAATFMILGDVCTRGCRFCAVPTGLPLPVNPREPVNVAQAVQAMGLLYAVVTSVTRDDLKDQGAGQFVRTVEEIRRAMPQTKIELLVPDFLGKDDAIQTIVAARPDVIGHNMEMARRLYPGVRPQADYDRSLGVLKKVKRLGGDLLVKSGFMVGLGENHDEILSTLKDLAEAGCDIVTIGQYLAPGSGGRHVPVARFVPPEEFENYRTNALTLGIKYVSSGPLVRSSFMAEQGYSSVIISERGA